MIVLKGWAINGTNCITKGRKYCFMFANNWLSAHDQPIFHSHTNGLYMKLKILGMVRLIWFFLRLNATLEKNLYWYCRINEGNMNIWWLKIKNDIMLQCECKVKRIRPSSSRYYMIFTLLEWKMGERMFALQIKPLITELNLNRHFYCINFN